VTRFSADRCPARSVDGGAVLLGNRRLTEDAGIDLASLPEAAELRREAGQTVMFVAVEGRAAGILRVADPIKPTTGRTSVSFMKTTC
jgi:Cu+-exporting ATPase